MSPRPSVPSYPADLQNQMFHAARFARALRAMHEDAAVDEVALLWLEGRADEVIVFTSDVLDAWAAGELTTSAATSAIDDYLHGLHATLEGWYGKWYAPSCCGPLASTQAGGVRKRGEAPRRRHNLLGDTMADSTVTDLRLGDRFASPGASGALASGHATA
jgi:hypothetical protein